jgi:phosphoribosylglycinamide formyltransferase-1
MNVRRKTGLGILVSGSGTNLQAIIDACEGGRVDADVNVVISDTPGAKALDRAQKHRIAAIVLERSDYENRMAFEEAIVSALRQHGVNLVCLAGFMRIIGSTLLAAFPNRIINIHPALLPSFPGLEGPKQALDYGVKVAGATVHFVDEKADHGPIIRQASVDVLEDDTIETLKARILEQEHRIYPEAIQLIAEERVAIEGRRVCIRR